LWPRALRSQRQDLRRWFTLYLRLTFSILLFCVRCGHLAVSMFASLCDSFTISAYDFRLHLSPTAQLGFYNFTSIDGMISPYHDYRCCDSHPRLRFRRAILPCKDVQQLAILIPNLAPGLPLAFAADSSIRNRRIDRLPWASIPACDDYGTCDSQSLQDFIVALRFCSTILCSITEVISADVFSCICELLSAFNLATVSLRTAHICS
jgi:hypothetical protein